MGNNAPRSLMSRLALDSRVWRWRGAGSVSIRPWRASLRVETVLRAWILRRRQRPDLVSQRAVSTDGFPDPSDLSLEHRRMDRRNPAVTPWRGAGIQPDQIECLASSSRWLMIFQPSGQD
jgi:hypothetical protein